MLSLHLLLFCLLIPASTESVRFEIIYDDRVIGEMSAQIERMGDREIYRNTTLVHTRVIRQIEVEYQSKVVFQNGILQEARVKSLLNGDIYSDMETQRSGEEYRVLKNGKLKNTLEGPITYSALQMLFEEPRGIQSAYSEEAGTFHDIQADGTTRYSKTNAKGRTNYYYYENNYLKKIEIDAGIVSFSMVRDD
jgi:hypothetical protein